MSLEDTGDLWKQRIPGKLRNENNFFCEIFLTYQDLQKKPNCALLPYFIKKRKTLKKMWLSFFQPITIV